MITYNFIFKCKYYLQGLGIDTDNPDSLSFTNIKWSLLDTIFRFKDLFDIGEIYVLLKFLQKKKNRFEKALKSPKWFGITSDNKISIKRYTNRSFNFSFATNMFSNKIEKYYLNKEGKIIINRAVKKSKSSNICILYNKDGNYYAYEESYISSLRKKKLPNKSKSLATILLVTLDSNKLKYISFAVWNENNLTNSNIVNAKEKILDECKLLMEKDIKSKKLAISLLALSGTMRGTRMIRM